MKATTYSLSEFGITKHSKRIARAIAVTTAAAIISLSSAASANAIGLSTVLHNVSSSVSRISRTVSGNNSRVESAIDTALLGAGVGALTGKNSKRAKENALIGAGAGIILGAVLDHRGEESSRRFHYSSRDPYTRHHRSSRHDYSRYADDDSRYASPETNVRMRRTRVIENGRVVSDKTVEYITSDARYAGYGVDPTLNSTEPAYRTRRYSR